MSWVVGAIIGKTTVEMKCPKCGARQLRARMPKGHRYTCKRCQKKFTEVDSRKAMMKKKMDTDNE